MFLTYRTAPVAVPAETVSENTTDQAPVPSLIAADERAGAAVSGVSAISVLAAEAAMFVSDVSFTAPASKRRCGVVYPIAAWRCASVSVIVTVAELPVEDTVAPVSAVPPLVPEPSRMCIFD